ncbi:ParD-like family protein [Sphingomonas sp. Leaf226]|uniref:ParD-like family protein n=1 Tax=Sphingomonas sp. Leaf226 TaxID=1735691 RepID=UPI0009EA5EB8|nr:ParD-like family protein [Sphingomonas sp. Leaf226]
MVKIDDELHEEARRASAVMCRPINAQAEFWMKIGMLAEANPTMAFNDIMKVQLAEANVRLVRRLPPDRAPPIIPTTCQN